MIFDKMNEPEKRQNCVYIALFCLVTCDDILPIKISSTLESNIRNNRYEKELE